MPRLGTPAPRTRVGLVIGALGLSVLVGTGAATAGRSHQPHAVPAPPASPTSASQIQNIDQVKTAIKGYYGDQIDPSRTNPIDGAPIHTFNPQGAYAKEVGGIVRRAEKTLVKLSHGKHSGKRAVLFDVDDTLLNTYSYEIYSNFVYNPTTNAAFVNAGVFRAVPHMAQLESVAKSLGYTVFFLTGRPEAQRAGTLVNLTNEGYTADNAKLFLKDYTVDTWLSSCAPACTTVQYKSLTRKHIESLGYDIKANFGDQYSDLTGGYADRTVKLPNPMYYLP
ncbi:MAG: HAD family acid phosphatase [Marmoricola sp.]